MCWSRGIVPVLVRLDVATFLLVVFQNRTVRVVPGWGIATQALDYRSSLVARVVAPRDLSSSCRFSVVDMAGVLMDLGSMEPADEVVLAVVEDCTAPHKVCMVEEHWQCCRSRLDVEKRRRRLGWHCEGGLRSTRLRPSLRFQASLGKTPLGLRTWEQESKSDRTVETLAP